jgi:hypothetical protein
MYEGQYYQCGAQQFEEGWRSVVIHDHDGCSLLERAIFSLYLFRNM